MHLAAPIIRGLVEKGMPCLFYEFGPLLNYTDMRSGPSEETLESQIGVRLGSCLYEMYRAVAIEGDDYRQRIGGR